MKLVLFFLLIMSAAIGGTEPNGVTIIDARHYSNVFGETRNFRIFLPPGYAASELKRYPVIYFFHGWSQRYFGSSNPYGDFDKGDDNGGDNIANFVADHEVIVVKPDGYNRSPDEPYYVRPYNVSPVETYRQFPLYFPELMNYIDSQYRTIANREHRAISGLSMGGFMTFWIGGKYPHLLSAAGNFCGSPEFVVGPKDFPSEYRHLDMYNNYGGMNVRLHYGNKDFIRDYHLDLNKVWTQVMDNYEYKVYDAAHSTCGMRDMFVAIMKTFDNPPARPEKWSHTDVYPQFSVWDYDVMTDRSASGFTALEKVNPEGFRIAVREFLPDGAVMADVKVSVTTAPRYEKNQWYAVTDIDLVTSKMTQKNIRSDAEGRLTIALNGSVHEVGIQKENNSPVLSLARVGFSNRAWATTGEDVDLHVTVVNKGGAPAEKVNATLEPMRSTARVTAAKATLGKIAAGATGKAGSFSVRVDEDTVAMERFKLILRDDRKNEWIEYFEVPFHAPAPGTTSFRIADGREVTVTKSGTGEETLVLGKGNGDGVANPGESIVVLMEDRGKLWRADLTGTNAHVDPFGVRMRKSDNWTSFDHVGASAKYDVPLIASDCPAGTTLEFLAGYWLPEYPLHHERWGTVRIPVKGSDTTPPVIDRAQMKADNVFQVRIYDGAPVTQVTVTLTDEKDTARRIKAELNDRGTDGDLAGSDLIFSARIPDQVFGIFHAVVVATDAHGNTQEQKLEEKFVVH